MKCYSVAQKPLFRLIRTLGSRVHDQLRDHAKQEVLDQAKGEAEVGPVMAELQNVQAVALEVDVAIEVLLVESLHGNLLATVGLTVLCLVELKVCLDGLARELGLLVLAGGIFGGDNPESGEDRQVNDQSEEDPCLQPSAELPGNIGGDTDKQRDQGGVGEVVTAIAICGQRSIGDRWVLHSHHQ